MLSMYRINNLLLCVCVISMAPVNTQKQTNARARTHTHTHIYIYIYIYTPCWISTQIVVAYQVMPQGTRDRYIVGPGDGSFI